jgi:hypothetical protein
MRDHRNSKRTTWTDTLRSLNNMEKLDEMMFCRDDMERYDYPLEMLQGITTNIDRIITEGMQNRK